MANALNQSLGDRAKPSFNLSKVPPLQGSSVTWPICAEPASRHAAGRMGLLVRVHQVRPGVRRSDEVAGTAGGYVRARDFPCRAVRCRSTAACVKLVRKLTMMRALSCLVLRQTPRGALTNAVHFRAVWLWPEAISNFRPTEATIITTPAPY